MKKPLIIIIVIVCISGWYSCTKDTAPVAAAAPACDSTHVSYTKSIVPILNTYCNNQSGCHSNSLGLGASANDLTVYYNVKNEMAADSPGVNSILCRVQSAYCGNDRMPKNGRPLNQVYIDTFYLWKAGGYCD